MPAMRGEERSALREGVDEMSSVDLKGVMLTTDTTAVSFWMVLAALAGAMA